MLVARHENDAIIVHDLLRFKCFHNRDDAWKSRRLEEEEKSQKSVIYSDGKDEKFPTDANMKSQHTRFYFPLAFQPEVDRRVFHTQEQRL